MATLHAKLSASGSERWLKCTGSVKAEESYPNTTSVFAEEGTLAHELAEVALNAGLPATHYIGQKLPENNANEITAEMADYVQIYIDYVQSLGGHQLYEQRVDFSEWVSDGFGTSDAIIIKDDTLHVVDLKYGKGVKVYADNNSQGMLYALGAYSDFGNIYDIKQVVISIVQPRLDHIDQSEPIAIADLLKFGEYARLKADEALSGKGLRVAGEKQCQFCKAKAECGELKRVTEKAIMAQFEQIDELKPADTLDNEALRFALENKKLIISWLDAVENLITDKLQKGEVFEGYKLVEGRSLRDWSDELEAATVLTELLGDDAYTKKLLSVTQAEKALGKAKAEAIAKLIVKPNGKPTLAPESDKRVAINIDANSFDLE
jgi:hypothetical protein